MLARIVLVVLLATWIGCGKNSSGGGAKDGAAASPQEAQLAELTQLVRRYAAEQRHAPKTLDELVTAGYLSQLPEAPAGKKFAISPKLEVYLVKR